MREEDIEKQVFGWFYTYGIPCWTNRKTSFSNAVFTTKGTQKKPDLIIFSSFLQSYIAIEVKDGDTNRNIYDGSKITEYMRDYTKGKTKYYINDKEIHITNFTLATQHSHNGRLFNENELSDRYNEWVSHPKKEYKETKQFLRQLWGSWRRTRTYEDKGLGIILSLVLNDGEQAPMIFTQEQRDKRWRVIWSPL